MCSKCTWDLLNQVRHAALGVTDEVYVHSSLYGAGVRACHPGPGGESTRVVQRAEAPRRKHGPAPLLCFLQKREGRAGKHLRIGWFEKYCRTSEHVACLIPGPGVF